ncbi:phosphate acyltransferase PlsX [Candidatus Erwinia haradaeae]|uniref:Phosphate acyltransferase n=1 Tax=Candidatus Erwinia haradaeae TaxID=1922217 RepID=A0A803GD44_9GAMM|nr:phosphate acyltransferase PlsX [Candidatus Erwinia haradaeae]VFP88533.1 Phosphate acyltransferase [Candidatus Erwinia haradaeae]
MKNLTLAIDVMGGDYGASITVPASVQALLLNPYLHIILVGNPDIIKKLLVNEDIFLRSRLEIVASKSVISENAKPSECIRSSHGSSMRITLEQVKKGRAHACVSAGNTGAIMGLAKLLLKPLNGIDRPALMTILPNQKANQTVMLDVGANIVAESALLVQFAIMGSVIAEELLTIHEPRVSLINIGQEPIKGLSSIQDAALMLQSSKEINFIGYVEGHDLLSGKTDVLICNGFIGNIILKTIEGIVRMFLFLLDSNNQEKKQSCHHNQLKKWFNEDLVNKFHYLNPDKYNGALLLGLQGVVVKSHGSANNLGFIAAIQKAEQIVQQRVLDRISMCVQALLSKNG